MPQPLRPRATITAIARGWLQAGLGGLLVTCAFAGSAAPATYALDPVHTRVMFAVEHAGFSKAIGTVSGSTGTLSFDPDDWSGARLEAQVPIARFDLGDEKWNKAAAARNLLDTGEHPVATFASTRIEPIDATHASVFGTLTLRGVAQEVKLDVTLNALKRHPMPPFRRTVGFSATTTISRKAFGLTAWPTLIGDQVELRIEAEAKRARGDGEVEPDTGETQDAADATGALQPAEADTAEPTPASGPSGVPIAPQEPATEPEPKPEPTP
jgi:polyisoprenoid-binding protein YceI